MSRRGAINREFKEPTCYLETAFQKTFPTDDAREWQGVASAAADSIKKKISSTHFTTHIPVMAGSWNGPVNGQRQGVGMNRKEREGKRRRVALIKK